MDNKRMLSPTKSKALLLGALILMLGFNKPEEL